MEVGGRGRRVRFSDLVPSAESGEEASRGLRELDKITNSVLGRPCSLSAVGGGGERERERGGGGGGERYDLVENKTAAAAEHAINGACLRPLSAAAAQ